MAKTRTSSAVKNRYNAKVYDRFNITVPKGRKAVIQAAAKSTGESLNAFVCTAINQRMEIDGDDEYCNKLYEEYKSGSDKDDFMPLNEFAASMGYKP